MIPGLADVEAVARAGSTILGAVKKSDQRTRRDVRESLMELFAILDDWCDMAEETTLFLTPGTHPRDLDIAPRQMRAEVLPAILKDIDGLYTEKAPILVRWRASKRRQAARLSLRTLLKIYCPDLFDQVLNATEDRAEWILRYRAQVAAVPEFGEEHRALADDATATARALFAARARLREFIVATYSIGDIEHAAE
ncbi:hypothetical protein GCM10023194_36580 [Planotetraspora phitsanulokensis]|uniref:Uncharacterized protein n=1 Tax=Planotetraspora phitsanulokensis TaxID=575192 RepID=A0A8J3XCP0_9ACTN|nr:hypothetical protein Pph01_12180 [Planotetraspora phitsanulokensis]